MSGPPERKRVLITVRTYPTPSAKVVEQSCTAGVTDTGEWIRLFPIPWRFLSNAQKFRKYEWIELTVHKASEARPESYNPECDSIDVLSEPLPSNDGWAARKDVVFPLLSHCLCCLKGERDENGFPTLGIFKPWRIKRLRFEAEDEPTWNDGELARLNQTQMHFVDGVAQLEPPVKVAPLEKIPMKFYYDFECEHAECKGHSLSCTDWEMLEAYRAWRAKYGEAVWEAKFREKFEDAMINKLDTHFYVGTVSTHPQNWMIVGLFYPYPHFWDPAGPEHPQPSRQPELFSLLPD